jgi:hypothetical protein
MLKELIKNLKKEPNFFYSWQSNIAMAFKDEYGRSKKKWKSRNDIHKIANQAAINFLNKLIYTTGK